MEPTPKKGNDKSEDPDKGKSVKSAGKPSEANVFVLDDAFPDAANVFSTSIVPSIDQCDALVVIDTNALLLPYKLASGELASLRETYETLAAKNRLFIPARVAREFIANRDEKLAELIKGLLDESSQIPSTTKPLPRHLRSAPGHDELTEAGSALNDARRAYQKAVAKVKEAVAAWRGNDPVTLVYAALFNLKNIVEHDGDREAVALEWAKRLRDRIPPGFKDGGKDDTGIGDFLIWKSILKLGKEHKKDLVFVTGEQKTDWMVRLNKEGLYPRPELLLEYKRVSNGCSLRLSSLAHLLEEMKAPEDVVHEVRTAEDVANAKARATYVLIGSPQIHSSHRSVIEQRFDYSTHNGNLKINTNNGNFDLQFSKCSNERIYLIKSGNAARIARAKGVAPGQTVSIESFDSSSYTYAIGLGELFLVENSTGDLLVGRIEHIADDTRDNAPADEVRFSFSTYSNGSQAIAT